MPATGARRRSEPPPRTEVSEVSTATVVAAATAALGQVMGVGVAPGNAHLVVLGVGVVPGNAQLVVTWTAVDNATGYTVQWMSSGQGYNIGDRQATVTTGSTTRYTIPSLTNGTEYTVRVIATRTGATDGPPSEEMTGTPRVPRTGQRAAGGDLDGATPPTRRRAANTTTPATDRPRSRG